MTNSDLTQVAQVTQLTEILKFRVTRVVAEEFWNHCESRDKNPSQVLRSLVESYCESCNYSDKNSGVGSLDVGSVRKAPQTGSGLYLHERIDSVSASIHSRLDDLQEQLADHSLLAALEAVLKAKRFNLPVNVGEVSEGSKEGKGTPSQSEKGTTKLWTKKLPVELEPYRELILEWWEKKKGRKSQRSYNGAVKGLQYIYGSIANNGTVDTVEAMNEVLNSAISNDWKGFSKENFDRYSPYGKSARERLERQRKWAAKNGEPDPVDPLAKYKSDPEWVMLNADFNAACDAGLFEERERLRALRQQRQDQIDSLSDGTPCSVEF